jgi:hypothetical protein
LPVKALALGDVGEDAMGARLPVRSVMDAAVDQDSERLAVLLPKVAHQFVDAARRR